MTAETHPRAVAGRRIDCREAGHVVAFVSVEGEVVTVTGRRHAVDAVVYAACGNAPAPLGYSLGPGVETGVLEDSE